MKKKFMQHNLIIKFTAALALTALFATLTLTAQTALPPQTVLTKGGGTKTGLLVIYKSKEEMTWQLDANLQNAWPAGIFQSAKYISDETGSRVIFYETANFDGVKKIKETEKLDFNTISAGTFIELPTVAEFQNQDTIMRDVFKRSTVKNDKQGAMNRPPDSLRTKTYQIQGKPSISRPDGTVVRPGEETKFKEIK